MEWKVTRKVREGIKVPIFWVQMGHQVVVPILFLRVFSNPTRYSVLPILRTYPFYLTAIRRQGVVS
jgi:hypothetical protein